MAETGLQNHLRAIRTRLGMSQQELARAANVTRQTIGGIEAGQYSPTAAVAMRLARALGCRVEDVFWLEDDLPAVEAAAAHGLSNMPGERVSLARVDGRWVAHPLARESAFRWEMVPADGITSHRDGDTVRVETTDDPEALARTVVLAGCAPALSLWARSAERWHPGLRVQWVHANSTAALQALSRREVHAAGLHMRDPETGDFNAPFVRKALPGRKITLINLGVWKEGLALAPGNPLGATSILDLPRLRMVNRELGAGSRALLDASLTEAEIEPARIAGYDRIVTSHQGVARAVSGGEADTGVCSEAVARLYGLDFLPLQRVRYDLAAPTEDIDQDPLRSLLSTLQHRWVHTQLRIMGGYETNTTGEVMATIG